MPANLTPFDSFLRDASTWATSMWGMWIILAFVAVAATVIVVVAKLRARARDRVPHYRRQEN